MWWTGLRIFPLPIYWCSSTSYYSVIWIITFLCTVLLGASFFTCTVISRCTVRCTVLYRCIDRIPSHQESLLIAVCCVYSVWLCWCCVVHKLSRSLRTRPVRERTFRLHKFRYWWKTVNSLFPSFYQIICLFAGSMNSIFAVHSISITFFLVRICVDCFVVSRVSTRSLHVSILHEKGLDVLTFELTNFLSLF